MPHNPQRNAMQCPKKKHPPGLKRANLVEFAVREGLRKDAGVEEPEQIPLRARLGLEVPKHPAAGILLVDFELSFDEASGVVFERLIPRLDEVDVGAAADEAAARVCAVVTGADAVAVEGCGAVGHCGGPFADDLPVV